MNYKSKISSYVIGGEYKGHQWLSRKSLFRFLGYIRLTERDITILTHGGCTYIGTLSDEFGVFVGFDTAHAMDIDHPRPFNYVYEECQHIIDQLIEGGGQIARP